MRAPALFAISILAGAAGACSPRTAPSAIAFDLDCRLPYDALARRIMAQPELAQTPDEPGEPYRYYRQGDGAVAYVFTKPGAPGHPAIFRQETTHVGGAKHMKTTGCPYGDKAGFAQVMTYLQSLS